MRSEHEFARLPATYPIWHGCPDAPAAEIAEEIGAAQAGQRCAPVDITSRNRITEAMRIDGDGRRRLFEEQATRKERVTFEGIPTIILSRRRCPPVDS